MRRRLHHHDLRRMLSWLFHVPTLNLSSPLSFTVRVVQYSRTLISQIQVGNAGEYSHFFPRIIHNYLQFCAFIGYVFQLVFYHKATEEFIRIISIQIL